ncbi:MAG: hypothetical protein RL293_2083 [Bacteroidota bacterium]
MCLNQRIIKKVKTTFNKRKSMKNQVCFCIGINGMLSKLLGLLAFCFMVSCRSSTDHTKPQEAKVSSSDKIDRELYAKFLRNLEKTLWSSPHFVRAKDPQETHNFTENPDTSLTTYELKIIEIDNAFTNQHAKDFTLPIQVEMSNGRTSIIPLEFYYGPKTTSSYRERIFYFPFAEGIIVNYRTVDNDEFHLTWEADRILQETNEHIELEMTKQLLWKKAK